MEQDLFYANKIRIRVCGLIIKNDKILLVEHHLNNKVFFAPPGGAVEFGESIDQALVREVIEETGLEINSSQFKFITEYIQSPMHAIELFHYIKSWSGQVITGKDPENLTLIKSVKWYTINEIKNMPTDKVHHIFHYCNNLRDIFELSGYIPYPSF